MIYAKIKDYKLKKTATPFLYFEGQIHLYLSVYLYFIL